MIDETINGVHYRTFTKMEVMTQFHVARRVAPLLAKSAAAGSEMDSFLTFSDVLSSASDEDCNYVIVNAMATVQREQSGPSGNSLWSPIWNVAARKPMFDDIDMVVMLRLAIAVVRDNIGNFLPSLLQQSPQESPGPNGPSTG